MKKSYFKNLPVILLAAAIALSPSFSAGEIEGGRIIEIRIEDILLVILGLVWIANFLISGRKKVEKPPLFFPIVLWLSVILISTLTNWTFQNIGFSQGFFFLLKEIQFFFLYFYLFYHIKSFSFSKFIIKFWIFLGLVNVAWIIFELITGLRISYYYGPTAFIEPEGPLPSGGFFLLIFIFLFNILLYYYFNLNISNLKKGLLAIATISPVIGVLTSGSRASFFGLIFAFILTFLFYSFKKGFFRSSLVGIFVFIFIISIPLIFPQLDIMNRFLNPETTFEQFNLENPASRISIWKNQLLYVAERPLFLLFGLGKSIILKGEQPHSQYLQNLNETGIVGSLIFLFLMFAIVKKSFQGFFKGKDPFLIGLSSGLLVATLTMLFISIAAEAFMVVKIAEVYWFFVALTMAVLVLNKSKEI